ncbi:MAG TPA: crosslink repair DNA glycosylase YcaQ family protein [Geminicoccaceae bacterium]|nr:crosslink repair DNA glycosylase YcaQ family protein [Geminicoccaceae bacterium]
MTVTISADQARRLVLSLQGLADPPRRRLAARGLADLIERLGFVQVDSINTVARAHHMILFARNETYRPPLLRRLHEDERVLFEHWTDRIASLLPIRFYPYWRLRFAREQRVVEARFKRWFGDGFALELEKLLERIRADGAIRARDLEVERARASAGWWDWHAGKTALEYLWRTGRLAIARRDGFQKVYDLPERVIPEAARRHRPSEAELIDWACRGALERLGFASPSEIAGFFGLVSIEEARDWCARHRGGAAVPALVAAANGATPRKLFARSDIEALLASVPDPPPRLRALNPFDPLLRDRARLARLFGFDYRIEVFVPAARRTYGYYVLPLLEGEALVGRLDTRADRAAGVLEVNALWMEPAYRLTRGRRQRLEAELERIRRFVGVDSVRFEGGYLKRNG